MPAKKQTTTKTETPVVATPVAKVEAKSASKKAEVKAESNKQTKKSTSVKAEPKVEAVVAPVETATESEEKKGRRQVTKQSVYDDIATLITKITEEIDKRQPSAAPAEGAAADASKKPKRKKEAGVPLKFLRSINKRLATIQGDAAKMMKLNRQTNRDNTKSGLMKPVAISEALYNFLKNAGKDKDGNSYAVEKNGKYARVEITRKIHSYIEHNKLRKGENLSETEVVAIKAKDPNARPRDFRVILPDGKLAGLLNYNPASATEEMTYFRLPQYLKDHFISEAKAQ
jgi:hypothetical protein